MQSDEREALRRHDVAVFGALAAVTSAGVSASVKGAISIPVYPALRIALQASANGHLSKASLQMEWRKIHELSVYKQPPAPYLVG